MFKNRSDLLQTVDDQLLGQSTCAGSKAACGFSVCLSCLDDDAIDTIVDTDYWKTVHDIIDHYDMQVLMMTRENALEWAVSQLVARNRHKLMDSNSEFLALPLRSSGHYMPCSSYTLDGCSEEQQEWVKKQKMTLSITELRKLVEHHHRVTAMFQSVREALLARNPHQRVMWVTMEDMQHNQSWHNLYNFLGLSGRVPEMYSMHGRYVHSLANYGAVKHLAKELNCSFD